MTFPLTTFPAANWPTFAVLVAVDFKVRLSLVLSFEVVLPKLSVPVMFRVSLAAFDICKPPALVLLTTRFIIVLPEKVLPEMVCERVPLSSRLPLLTIKLPGSLLMVPATCSVAPVTVKVEPV